MDKTHVSSSFNICSNGELSREGLVSSENGAFDPAEITTLLQIEPFKSWKKGDIMKNGRVALFSTWSALKSQTDRIDAETQCMEIVEMLKSKIYELNQIRAKYDISFTIVIVAHVYGEEKPLISFNKEIIEFCYLTGTTIDIDTYIYQKEEVSRNGLS